jgi:uncharacterized protein YgbK (DUF1537 family)
MTLLIIADDLTGAADSAARCHHAGLPAHIYVQPPQTLLPAGAVALSSDSRYLSPSAAASRVAELLTHFIHQPDLVWYKKIDSTLRGNIGAELDAMLAGLSATGQPTCVIICPAFPAQGRGLEEGYLVYGQTPPRSLHLPTILAQQTARSMATFSIRDVRAGVEQLAARLLSARQRQAQLLVVDALTDADLNTLLAAAKVALPTALFCGSAGLIEQLARDLALLSPAEPVEAEPAALLKQPVLAIVGSGSGMAHRQLAALRALPNVRVFTASSVQEAFDKLSNRSNRVERIGWVCHLPPPGPDDALEGPTARRLALSLAQVGTALVHSLLPQTLILVGGDTTVHVLEQLGIHQLTVVAELLPGIPLVAGVDAQGKTYQLITKAGNFGDEQTLVYLFQQAGKVKELTL